MENMKIYAVNTKKVILESECVKLLSILDNMKESESITESDDTFISDFLSRTNLLKIDTDYEIKFT